MYDRRAHLSTILQGVYDWRREANCLRDMAERTASEHVYASLLSEARIADKMADQYLEAAITEFS